MGVPWLRRDSDDLSIEKIDPCEAGTCGHAGCWQDEPTVWLTPPRYRTERCENSTGWTYCGHSSGPMALCVCGCTCRDQRHCGTELQRDIDRADAHMDSRP